MHSLISRLSLAVCLLFEVRAMPLQAVSLPDRAPKEPGSGVVHWTVETGG